MVAIGLISATIATTSGSGGGRRPILGTRGCSNGMLIGGGLIGIGLMLMGGPGCPHPQLIRARSQ